MNKVTSGIVILLLVLVGGYFVDDSYKAKVDRLLHKDAAVVSAASNNASDWSNAKSDAPAAALPIQRGGTLANILASGVVRVSAQNPSKPFYFHDNRGTAKGFNVDFMKALFAQSEFGNHDIKLDTGHEVDAYEKVPKQLLQGNAVDVAIDGLTFNDDDLKGVVYTIPYVKDFGYALIAQKNSSITSVDSADGKTIGILKGDPDAMAFAKHTFPKSRLVELSDKADANGKWIVGYVDSRQVDAVVYDYPFAVSELEGTELQFVSPKIAGSNIEYKIGVRASDRDLLDALNSAIRKVTASDAYTDLLKTYFMSSKVAAVRSAKGNETVYVVVRGDTLSTIAQVRLGDKMRYPEIQSRNNLANPNFIAIGQKLVIPK
ncbi:MAG: transporter substrate-binding domain-containing protein [Betaproteobacteria bacterium]